MVMQFQSCEMNKINMEFSDDETKKELADEVEASSDSDNEFWKSIEDENLLKIELKSVQSSRNRKRYSHKASNRPSNSKHTQPIPEHEKPEPKTSDPSHVHKVARSPVLDGSESYITLKPVATNSLGEIEMIR
jgi:hypothetical protein